MKTNLFCKILLSLLVQYNVCTAILIHGAHTTAPTETWNFMVCLADNNNLYRYATQNIEQMLKIGSTPYINIYVQTDNFGKREVTRYKVEKGHLIQISIIKNPPECLSGTQENLVGFVKDVVTRSPAAHQALVLWNHGSGAEDPNIWNKAQSLNRDACFYFNPKTNLFEIQREALRGIAFNDIGHTYLTNQDLKCALNKIITEVLQGKKFDLISMDACHMAMAEICTQIKSAATYMVASEEIEPAAGYNYNDILEPFIARSLSPYEFAQHIVNAYDTKYNHSFADLTHSAINLDAYNVFEQNLNILSSTLIDFIKVDPNFFHLIQSIRRDPNLTTSFINANYIDIAHFYRSLLAKIENFQVPETRRLLMAQLKVTLQQGIELLTTCIIRNATGPNAKTAEGLSIYFPTRAIHTSYLQNDLAKNTNWYNFLYSFLKTSRSTAARKSKS